MAAKKHKTLKSIDYVHLFRHKLFCGFCDSLRLNRKSVNYFCAFMKDAKLQIDFPQDDGFRINTIIIQSILLILSKSCR